MIIQELLTVNNGVIRIIITNSSTKTQLFATDSTADGNVNIDKPDKFYLSQLTKAGSVVTVNGPPPEFI